MGNQQKRQADLLASPSQDPPAPAPQERPLYVGPQLKPVLPLARTGTPDVTSLLEMAVSGGLSPEGLEKLVLLQERILDRNAAAEFSRAMQAFQAECPTISKNRTVTVTTRGGAPYSYDYAELSHIAEEIRPLLDRHGLSYAFDSDWTENRIVVTCIVRHVGGHSERTKFSCPASSNAGMSDQQKAASALSYAQRYAMRMAFGLTTGEGRDDDGGAGEAAPVTQKQADDLRALSEDVGADAKKFLAYIGASSFETIPAADYHRAVQALEQKRGKPKAAPAAAPKPAPRVPNFGGKDEELFR